MGAPLKKENTMIKTSVSSIEPCFDSPYPFQVVNINFEQKVMHNGTSFHNHARVSVVVEKKNQNLEELRSDAIEAAVKFLSALTEDR